LKFKYLIIAFSILIVLFLLITALLPTFVPEPVYTANLRYVTSPLLILMSVILVCLGIFFLINYRLFLLLEREDWPALAYYLEQKIYVKNNYSSRYVKLLASSYIVISDYPSVVKLESKLFIAKRSVVEKNALIFGAARVISGDYKGAASFFKTILEKGKLNKEDMGWVHWFYGFSSLLNSSFDKAETEFMGMAVNSSDAILAGISAYFLANNLSGKSLRQQDCLDAAEKGRKRVIDSLKTPEGWKKEVIKAETAIHVAVIRKYINEAGIWLFQDKEPASTAEAEDDLKKSHLDDLKDHGSSRHNSSHPIISDKRYIKEDSSIKDTDTHDPESL